MKLDEFKRRLMTDPRERSAGMREARRAGDEFEAAAQASDRFEHALDRALDVPVPPGLSDRIILRQSLEGQKRTMRWVQWGAVAAVLAIAAGVASVLLNPATSPADLERHVVWHWKHDGPQVLAASLQGPEDPDHVQEVLAALGVQVAPPLLSQVRLVKFCPTPDGKGAHLVLDGPDGPLTMYYMPRTHLAESPVSMSLDDGQRAVAVNLQRGSLALIGSAGTDLEALARELSGYLAEAPDATI